MRAEAQPKLAAPTHKPGHLASSLSRNAKAQAERAKPKEEESNASAARVKGPCDPPYTIDDNGIKRFKAACFR